MPVIVAAPPGVGDTLRTGSGILVHQHRIFLTGVKIGRLQHVAVQPGAVNGGHGEEFFRYQTILFGRSGQSGIVFQHFNQLIPPGLVQLYPVGCGGRAVVVQVILKIATHVHPVYAFVHRESLLFAVLQVNGIEVGLQGRLLMRGIVHHRPFTPTHPHQLGYLPVAVRNLLYQLAGHIIQINMTVTVLLAGGDNVAAIGQINQFFHIYIGVRAVGE